MKKKISLLIVTLLVVISLFAFNAKVNATELTNQEKITNELNNIYVPQKAIIDFPVTSVSAYGSTITWESSNTSVLNVPTNGGWVQVIRPNDNDARVVLTVTLELNGVSSSKQFTVLVPKGTTHTNTYHISYVLNGGLNNENNPTTYEVGNNPTLLNPTKGTVEFLGWYDNEFFNGDSLTALPKGVSGDVTLYAKWENAVVTGIEITTLPTKLTYNAYENFDYSGLVITANYNDNSSVVIDNSLLEFNKTQLVAVDTKVVVSFAGFNKDIDVTVNKLNYDMSAVVFADTSKVYNGQQQTIEVTNLPIGVTVASYTNGLTNVGSVNITATFVVSDDNYNVPAPKSATLTITKASYDMSSVIFDDDQKVYNGLVQNLVASNLPTGVSATYSAGLKDVGTMEIIATFTGDDNYFVPEAMSATLTITKALLSIKADAKSMMVGDTVPSFTASYEGFVNSETKDVLGGTLSFSCSATTASPAGTYAIIPSGLTSNNYEITFVSSNLSVNSGTYTIVVPETSLNTVYDGTNKMITATLKDGENTISGISFTYQLNNETITEAINVGTYEILVSYDDATYGSGSQSFSLVIAKATYDMSAVLFDDVESTYTGSNQMISVTNLPVGVSVDYNQTGLTNVGSVVITATFTVDDNYNVPEAMTATLTIVAKELALTMFDAIGTKSHTGSAITPIVHGVFASTDLLLDTDYTVAYQNNTDVGNAKVVVTGINNFQGTIDIPFIIGPSELSKVTVASSEIESLYNDILTGVVSTEVEDLALTTTNGSSVFWMSTNTAIGVNPQTGAVTFNLTNVEQKATVYALITNGDAAEYASFEITVPAYLTMTDEVNNVQIEGAVEAGTIVNATPIAESEFANYTVAEGENIVAAFDIKLLQDSVEVQPNGSVIVRIPVPTGYEADETLKVYHVNATNGALEDMNATIVDGKLVFTATSFSEYVIVNEEPTIPVKTISELLALEAGDTYYQVTGIVRNIINTQYGNFDLVDPIDSTIKIYVYGLLTAEMVNKQFESLNINDGDTLTLIGKRAIYDNKAQIGGAYYVSHTPKVWTDAEKVEEDKANLTVDSTMNSDVDLPTTGSKGTNVTWSVVSGTAIALTDNHVTVTRPAQGESDATVVLRATLTSNAVSDSKDFTVTVKAYASLSVVIYEVYGAGGNSGAAYKYDYVVLKNITSASISLENYTLQYASATGAFASKVTLSGNIPANGYYLIQLSDGENGSELPITANVTGSISAGASNFKFALANDTETVSTKTDANVVDFVGAGTATTYLGTGAAPAPSATNSIKRTAYTGDNSSDFTLSAADLSYLVTGTKLTAPTITLNETTITWSAINNAIGYDVYDDDTLLTSSHITDCTYTIELDNTSLHNITVVAIGDNIDYLNSIKSNVIEYGTNPQGSYQKLLVTMDSKETEPVTVGNISYTMNNTYNTWNQMTSGNKMTITITAGANIGSLSLEKLILNMKTNTSKGQGSISVKLNGEEKNNIAELVKNDDGKTGFSTTFAERVFTLTNPIALVANDVIVIEISTTANSIYVQGFGFMYVDSSSN